MSNAAPSHYKKLAAGQAATLLSASGAAGDFIDTLICIVSTAATAQVDLVDGTTTFNVFPNSPGGGVGTYVLAIKLKSQTGAWKAVTGAGVAIIASGNFT